MVSCGISGSFEPLSPAQRQITHALLTRAPLYSGRSPFSFDLHVLGTPPAFVLSQDQTLHLILSPPRLKGGHKYENALALPSQPDFQRADDFCFVVERVGRLSIGQAPVKFFFSTPFFFAAGCFRFRLAPRTLGGLYRRGALGPQVFFEAVVSFFSSGIRIALAIPRLLDERRSREGFIII